MKLFGILLLICIGNQVLAQDTTKTIDTTKRYLELNPVMVMGVRADSKTPVSQKIVNRDDVQKVYQGQEIPILLDKTPSITSQSDGGHPQGYTYFRIRGIDQSRVNMTLNGVPLNEPEDQGVYTSNYPGFINVIQSMQVQRGVGTSTNGVASYAGSINFISQTGLEKSTEAAIGYGSFNTKRMSVSAGTGLHKGFAFYGNFSAYSSDGYKYRSGGSGYSGFFSGGYYGTKDIVKVTAFTGKSINQMAWLAVADSVITKDPRTNTNKDLGDADDNFTQSLIQLQYVKTLNENSKFSTTIFYNRLDGRYDYFLSGNTGVSLASNFYGAIASYKFKKKNLSLNTGVSINSYNRQHVNSEDHSQDYGIGLYTNKGIKREVSLFSKIGYDIRKFTTFVDLQYRHADFRYRGDVEMKQFNWDFLMPKIGLTFNQEENLKYYASVGVSKREPTRTNIFGGMDNLVSVLDIKPEQVVDYELGVNFSTKNLKFQSNVYYMDFKNEITLLGALGSNSLPLMTNVTKSFRSGLETDLEIKNILKYFSLNTNVNYSYNRINDDGKKFQPLYTPTFVLNEGLSFECGGLGLNFNAKYQGESFISMDNKYQIPGFVIYGLNASYSYRKYTILVQGNNLTGKQYYTNGYVTDNTRYLFVNARQSIYVTFKIKL